MCGNIGLRHNAGNKALFRHPQLIGQCGPRGCKNRPNLFPGRTPYKATNAGFSFYVYFMLFWLFSLCIVSRYGYSCVNRILFYGLYCVIYCH